MDNLLLTTNESRRIILKELNKTEDDLNIDVNYIKEWIKSQPHLPEMPSTNMIEQFLLQAKFSLENTKQKLDTYYTMRNQIKNVLSPTKEKKETSKMQYLFPLPKLLDDKYRVIYSKVRPFKGVDYHQESLMWTAFNLFEIRLQEDFSMSTAFILDYSHITMNHIVSFTPKLAKLCTSVTEKIFNSRLKAVHVINYPPIIHISFNLLKTLMKDKLSNRIIFHPNSESLCEHIPLELLPGDYGGKEKFVDELEDMWVKKFADYQDYFDKLDSLKTIEALRPTPMNGLETFGVQGSFKKLEVD